MLSTIDEPVDNQSPHSKAAAAEQSAEESPLYRVRQFGFRALLGWHYLVLFSPLFVMGELQQNLQPLVQRQLTLYAVLALVFLVLALCIRASAKVRDVLIKAPFVGTVCVLGAVATLLAGTALDMGTAGKIAVFALLGACEAVLMLAWLTIFIGLSKKQTYRTLGMDVIVGSIVAILVESLLAPANVFVAACLPLLSMYSFIVLKREFEVEEASALDSAVREDSEKATPEDEEHAQDAESQTSAEDTAASVTEPVSEGPGSRRAASTGMYLLKFILPGALFGLAFGIIQGGFFADGKEVLMAFNPAAFLGVTLAGIITFFTLERFCTHSEVDFSYRISLGFFMLGIILLAALETLAPAGAPGTSAVVLVLANIAVFAGFNLFDFGNMMLCLSIVRLHGHAKDFLVATGRFAVYLCMCLGFAGSYCIVSQHPASESFAALVLTCCVALLILMLTMGLGALFFKNDNESLVNNGFGLVKGGVDTEETVCRFCDSDGECQIQVRARELARELGVEAAQSARENQESVANPKESAAASDLPQKPREEEGKHARAPWREACDEICKRYQLSKRETQIFMIIAKGRNAEYVSEQLVISIHTAKTHIANIYQKLDVHSSQEVLDLVDAFRADAEANSR